MFVECQSAGLPSMYTFAVNPWGGTEVVREGEKG